MKQLPVHFSTYPPRYLQGGIGYPPKPRGKRARRLVRWVQYFFLLVGLLAAGYCGWFYAEGRIYQAYQSWRFDQIVKHHAASVKASLVNYLVRIDFLPANEAAPSRVDTLSKAAPSAVQPRVALAEGSLIGRMEVPRLGLSTVVLEGDSTEVLRRGVGHIPSTALPGGLGNVAIAGHRDTFFRALKNIRNNDSITLETTAGTYQYRVGSVQVVGPDDTEVLAPSDHASLTLVTCYPFYFVGSAPDRYIVRAQQIDSSETAETAPLPTSAPSLESTSPSEANLTSRAAKHGAARQFRHAKRRPRAHRISAQASDEGRAAEETPAADLGRYKHKHRGVEGQTTQSSKAGRRLASWLLSLPKRALGN